MKKNYTWMQKWNIYFNVCPTNSKELKDFVMEKFRKKVWGKELGTKKKYYIEEFNPTCHLQGLKKLGKNVCVHFAHLGLRNRKNISFWNVMHSKRSEKVMRTC